MTNCVVFVCYILPVRLQSGCRYGIFYCCDIVTPPGEFPTLMHWNLTVLSARWRTHSRTFYSGQLLLSNSVVLLSTHHSEIFPLQRVSQHVSWCFKDTLKRSFFSLTFWVLDLASCLWSQLLCEMFTEEYHQNFYSLVKLFPIVVEDSSKLQNITWKYGYFLFVFIHIYLFIKKAIKSFKYSLSHSFKLCSNTLNVD